MTKKHLDWEESNANKVSAGQVVETAAVLLMLANSNHLEINV
jgi:hypothetical protein